MAEDKTNEVEDVKVDPISDEDLENVSGGILAEDDCTNCTVTGTCTGDAM